MEGINANDKIYKMSFSKVYPLLVTKCEKKDEQERKSIKLLAG